MISLKLIVNLHDNLVAYVVLLKINSRDLFIVISTQCWCFCSRPMVCCTNRGTLFWRHVGFCSTSHRIYTQFKCAFLDVCITSVLVGLYDTFTPIVLGWRWDTRIYAPAPVNMMTSSNGLIFRVTGHLCGEFTSRWWILTQRPVTRGFDAFFDLRLNKWLKKQWLGWWFETPSYSLWRHCNEKQLWRLRLKSIGTEPTETRQTGNCPHICWLYRKSLVGIWLLSQYINHTNVKVTPSMNTGRCR